MDAALGGQAALGDHDLQPAVLDGAINLYYRFLRSNKLEAGRGVGRDLRITEGSLDLARAPLWGNLPPVYSRGLPAGVLATWDGALQTISAGPSAAARRPNSDDSSAASSALLRLNGAVAAVRFSKPVVVRRLLMRPPVSASEAPQRLLVRASRRGQEIWRRAYDFDGRLSEPPPCGLGDIVIAEPTGVYPEGRVVIIHADDEALAADGAGTLPAAIVRGLGWGDDSGGVSSYQTLVERRLLRNLRGVACDESSPVNGVAPSAIEMSPWRNLARSMQDVDELSFMMPLGDPGWLLSELAVASAHSARRTSSDEQEGILVAGKDAEDEVEMLEVEETASSAGYVLQVLPGPHAIITEISGAALVYDAGDMLERGLQLRPGFQWPIETVAIATESTEEEPDAERTPVSQRIFVGRSRSSEAFQQFLRSLAVEGASSRLPSGVSAEACLEAAERLVNRLSAFTEHDVDKFWHFEAFFAAQWDWGSPSDALEVTFERWRHSADVRSEAADALHQGQRWEGFYHCGAGPTLLFLEIIDAVLETDGRTLVRAALTFKTERTGSWTGVEGTYEVAGHLAPEGRTLALEPVEGGWLQRPGGFVAVGLQGVVSRSAKGLLRFAGVVATVGCDDFQLQAWVQGTRDDSEEIAFILTNAELDDKEVPGVGFRLAPRMEARDGVSFAAWGEKVFGHPLSSEAGAWLRTTDGRFLPLTLPNGEAVLRAETASYEEIAEMQATRSAAFAENATLRPKVVQALRPRRFESATFPADLRELVTLGAPALGRSAGKYYYEARLGTGAAATRVGWLVDGFASSEAFVAEGIGDDDCSWGADGYDRATWYNGSNLIGKWPANWTSGDIIGCALDLDKGEMHFFYNGGWVEGAGITFQPGGRAFYPGLSARGAVVLYFSASSFHFAPPLAYEAFVGPEEGGGVVRWPLRRARNFAPKLSAAHLLEDGGQLSAVESEEETGPPGAPNTAAGEIPRHILEERTLELLSDFVDTAKTTWQDQLWRMSAKGASEEATFDTEAIAAQITKLLKGKKLALTTGAGGNMQVELATSDGKKIVLDIRQER